MARCLGHFQNDEVFGAGFVHGPNWLEEAQGHPERVAYYQERPWLPFVILRAEMVRQVLTGAFSFVPFMLYNDFAASQRLSRLVAAVQVPARLDIRRDRRAFARKVRRALSRRYPAGNVGWLRQRNGDGVRGGLGLTPARREVWAPRFARVMRIAIVSPYSPFDGVGHAGGAFLHAYVSHLSRDHAKDLICTETPNEQTLASYGSSVGVHFSPRCRGAVQVACDCKLAR